MGARCVLEPPHLPALFCALPHEALLQVSGPDAATFLQGQTTCDVREVNPQRARPGAYCNAQGRVLADFLLVQSATERYTLRLRADIADAIAGRLAKYVVFAKATVAVAGHAQVLACWGEGAAAALQPLVGTLPTAQYGCAAGEGFCLVQVDREGRQFELYLEGDRASDLAQSLGATLARGEVAQWQALQIAAGIGRVEQATLEAFLPQALNYDRIGFVSFNKGCYTGQEVVARLHYRGKSKRRTYLARSDGASPAAGHPVYAGNSEQAVGTVVNAVALPGGGAQLLVSLAQQALDKSLALDPAGGQALTISPPPYSLADAAG
jgi:tRNA-modifying protein YgfZ